MYTSPFSQEMVGMTHLLKRDGADIPGNLNTYGGRHPNLPYGVGISISLEKVEVSITISFMRMEVGIPNSFEGCR